MSQQKPEPTDGAPEPAETTAAGAAEAPAPVSAGTPTTSEPVVVVVEDDEDDDAALDEDDAYLLPAGSVVAAGPSLAARLGVEAFGTFALVFVGLGVALYSGAQLAGIGGGGGPLATALAFGLTLAALVAAVGRVSGGHFNPAVTFGAVLAGRTRWAHLVPYWLVQVAGGALGAGVVFLTVPNELPRLLSQTGEGTRRTLFATVANGFGEHSLLSVATQKQAAFSMVGALLIETVAVAVLVGVVLGATDRRAGRTLAPLAVGGAYTVLLLATFPVTNGALNPARALAAAFVAGDWTWSQVWLFWAAPLLGAAIAALVYRAFAAEPPEDSLFGEDELAVTEEDVLVVER